MNQVIRQPEGSMPSEIAAIGRELGQAIHRDHQRRKARRGRVARSMVVVAAIGLGSGTAFAAHLGLQEQNPLWWAHETRYTHEHGGRIVNRCVDNEIEHPWLYQNAQQRARACGLVLQRKLGPAIPPPRLPKPQTSVER